MSASDAARREVIVALRRIIRAIELHSHRLAKQFGLTGPQLLVLSEVAAGNALTAGEAARKVHLSQATVTIIVDRLVEQGFLVRSGDEADRRRVYLAVTEKARSLLGAHPSFLQDRFVERFERLEEPEKEKLLSSLRQVAEMMDADEAPVLPDRLPGLPAEIRERKTKA